MDWNDPDELRRLRDLLAADPAATTTIQGPTGPITDTVEMLVGRLGMPETGGSYFTFSNENNDLIWGFLKECHRRGWLYKGHDTMPWCARCGTGISQMEMNEGYADRDDPGLTVRFPLVDRPGEDLLVWTTTPWTLTSNVAAAVGESLRYVRVRQGEATHWLAKGTLKAALAGPFEVLEERPGAELVGWRYGGPFDDLPAVRRAFAAGASPIAAAAPYEHRVVAWDEVGEEEGTGIVHIAPGCGAEDHALGKALGLPMIAPLDESGIVIDGFGSLTGRDVRDVTDPIVEHLKREDRFYRLETIHHRYPHCWRCGTPLVFRLVDEWYISMGPVYDRPRAELTKDEVDASLRYGSSISATSSSRGRRGRSGVSSPRARRSARRPIGPKRSAAWSAVMPANLPRVSRPSLLRAPTSALASGSSGPSPAASVATGSGARNRPSARRVTTASRPTATKAAKRLGATAIRTRVRAASLAAAITPSRAPPWIRSSPSTSKKASPGRSDSTAAPIPSSLSSSRSQRSATPTGSDGTSRSEGQRASASERGIPASTPSASAAAETSPTTCLPPERGASATASSGRPPGWATRSEKRGMTTEAIIIRTYVRIANQRGQGPSHPGVGLQRRTRKLRKLPIPKPDLGW